MRHHAAAEGAVAEEYRLQTFALAVGFFGHWPAVQGGSRDRGARRLSAGGPQRLPGTGTVHNRTAFLTFFAQACATAGEVARRLAALDEGLALVQQTGEPWFQAETLPVRGELLQHEAAGQTDPEKILGSARACLERARQLAKKQGAKTFELRAAIGLYQLPQNQTRERESRDILLRALDKFDDGVDTTDIHRARALLRRS